MLYGEPRQNYLQQRLFAMKKEADQQQRRLSNNFGDWIQYQGPRPQIIAGPMKPGEPLNDLDSKQELKPKETHMLTEIAGDMKKFVKDHKSVIYWVAVLLLVDHVFFQGAFKEKLKTMMGKLVGRVEEKLNDASTKV